MAPRLGALEDEGHGVTLVEQEADAELRERQARLAGSLRAQADLTYTYTYVQEHNKMYI